MADENRKDMPETTTRGSSSQQAGKQTMTSSDLPETSMGRTGAPPGAVTHQPGQQRSEEAGMEQMSMMVREEGNLGAMGGRHMGSYEKGLCDREHGMSERERGMSERERGMSERERAMYDRECAMTDRGAQSRMGGQSGSIETQRNR